MGSGWEPVLCHGFRVGTRVMSQAQGGLRVMSQAQRGRPCYITGSAWAPVLSQVHSGGSVLFHTLLAGRTLLEQCCRSGLSVWDLVMNSLLFTCKLSHLLRGAHSRQVIVL